MQMSIYRGNILNFGSEIRHLGKCVWRHGDTEIFWKIGRNYSEEKRNSVFMPRKNMNKDPETWKSIKDFVGYALYK